MRNTVARRTAVGGLGLAVLRTSSHTVNDAFANILLVFLPTLQSRFGLGEAMLAGLVAIISLSSNVLQAFAGSVIDRWGRRRAAALALMAGSVLMSLVPVVPTVWALMLVLTVGGLGPAVFHPAAAAMARDASGRRALVVGVFGVGGPIGTAVMSVVALWLIRTYGPEAVPYLASVGVAAGAALWWMAPRQEVANRGWDRALHAVGPFKGPVGVLAMVGTLWAVAYISFQNAAPLYLVNVRGHAADASILGWTLAAYQVAAAGGLVLAGVLEHRVGRLRLVAGSMLFAFPLLLATLALPPGSFTYYLAVVLAGACTNGSIGILIVTAQDLAPESVTAASGMLMGFTWGIAGVAHIAFGAWQQAIGMAPALVGSYAFLIPAVLLAVRVWRRNPAIPR